LDLTTPVQLLIMAPSQKAMASREWSLATCHMLQDLATKVTDRMHEEGHDYTMTTADFNGLMIFRGGCLADGLKFGVIDVMPAVHMYGMYDMVADLLSNRNQTATQVYVHCQVDLFSEVGEAWMRAVRASLPRPDVIRQPLGGHQDADSANYVPYGRWDDVEIGALHLYGMPLEQMDGAQYTLRRMPYVGLAIAAIVCIILGGSFGTALIPVRAVICIAWMLVVTFGASVMVYQLGYLEGLGIQALSPSSGQALFWISPSVAVAVLVGLGLDYDMSGTRPRHVRDMSRTGRARPRLRHLLDGLGHGALAERQGRQVSGGHFSRPGGHHHLGRRRHHVLLAFGCEQGSVSEVSRKCL